MAELLPCPTPLSLEVAAKLMSGREGYGLAQRRLGFDPAPGSILERIAGHIYVDLDRENSLFFQHAPIGYAPAEIQENPLRAHLPRTSVQWRKLRTGLLVRWPVLGFQVARSLARQRRMGREFPTFFDQDWMPAFAGSMEEIRRRDLTGVEPPQLLAEFEDRLGHFLHHSAPVLLTGSILAAMRYRELEDLLIGHLGQGGIELAQKLISGLRPNPMLEMHEAMDRVAQDDESEAWFLERFGHRCGGDEFELAVPRWREDATSLRAQIGQLREMGRSGKGAIAQGRTVREEAESKLRDLSYRWGRVAQELTQARLQAARYLFPLRERCKDGLLVEFETLRRPLVLLDQQLQLAGGIFYLGLDELREAIARADAVRERIQERRRQHELCRLLSPPQVILGSQLVKSELPTQALAADGLAGVGVSPGVAQGPVRILRSAHDLLGVRKGEILVLPSLEPTWTSAFSRAAGLVAERGAVLSHGAIVAREFAMPAVVNVPGAMVRFREGQRITVNGTTGRIGLLAPGAEA
jgi:pyruvate,water dikinase